MSFNRFNIQEKVFSFGGKYVITDDSGHEAYLAKGKPFSLARHNEIFDSFGTKVYEFKKEIFSWKEIFFIHKDGEPVFRLFKKRISIPPEIFVESLTNTEAFYVQGDFWGRAYSFFKGEQLFATVSKKFPSFKDAYEVSVAKGFDEGLVLTVVLIIDQMKDKKKK